MTSPEAAAFEQWLAEATRGLPQPLAKDVRAETGSPFRGCRRGLPDRRALTAAARTAALADLGDAGDGTPYAAQSAPIPRRAPHCLDHLARAFACGSIAPSSPQRSSDCWH